MLACSPVEMLISVRLSSFSDAPRVSSMSSALDTDRKPVFKPSDRDTSRSGISLATRRCLPMRFTRTYYSRRCALRAMNGKAIWPAKAVRPSDDTAAALVEIASPKGTGAGRLAPIHDNDSNESGPSGGLSPAMCGCSTDRPYVRLDGLYGHSHAHAPAYTQTGQAHLHVAAPHLIGQGQDETSPRATNRVANGDA